MRTDESIRKCSADIQGIGCSSDLLMRKTTSVSVERLNEVHIPNFRVSSQFVASKISYFIIVSLTAAKALVSNHGEYSRGYREGHIQREVCHEM